MKKTALLFISLMVLLLRTNATNDSINITQARVYFSEVEKICNEDNGKFWGMDMYGPLMFIDQNNRMVISNETDNKGLFKSQGDVFVGKFPDSLTMANTSFEFNGKVWTMVIWQALSKDYYDRNSLILHELWHSKQEKLGFPSTYSKNTHLDLLYGRILLKMEWIALLKAFTENENRRTEHVKDALCFRKYRHDIFDSSQETESRFELHEGLAEYTGIAMAELPDSLLISTLKNKVSNNMDNHNLLMSCAYTTGPLYGLLLDKMNNNWRSKLTVKSDLGSILANEIGNPEINPDSCQINRLYEKYKAYDLIDKEKEYDIEKKEFLADCREKLVNDKKLTIPMAISKISFNPYGVVPFDKHGRIYKSLKARGEWGVMVAEKAALIDPMWQNIIISYPKKIDNNKASGDGWNITINEGWEFTKNINGDYCLSKIK